jgi:predicted Na+-dependent transporter
LPLKLHKRPKTFLLGPEKATREALAFSTPQRNSGIAMAIVAANFPGTPASLWR